jgi:hypothetical protein
MKKITAAQKLKASKNKGVISLTPLHNPKAPKAAKTASATATIEVTATATDGAKKKVLKVAPEKDIDEIVDPLEEAAESLKSPEAGTITLVKRLIDQAEHSFVRITKQYPDTDKNQINGILGQISLTKSALADLIAKTEASKVDESAELAAKTRTAEAAKAKAKTEAKAKAEAAKAKAEADKKAEAEKAKKDPRWKSLRLNGKKIAWILALIAAMVTIVVNWPRVKQTCGTWFKQSPVAVTPLGATTNNVATDNASALEAKNRQLEARLASLQNTSDGVMNSTASNATSIGARAPVGLGVQFTGSGWTNVATGNTGILNIGGSQNIYILTNATTTPRHSTVHAAHEGVSVPSELHCSPDSDGTYRWKMVLESGASLCYTIDSTDWLLTFEATAIESDITIQVRGHDGVWQPVKLGTNIGSVNCTGLRFIMKRDACESADLSFVLSTRK